MNTYSVICVGLQYICYTVAYPEQEGEEGKTDGNQTENLPLGLGGGFLFAFSLCFPRVFLLSPSSSLCHKCIVNLQKKVLHIKIAY